VSIVRVRQSQIVSTYGPGALVDLPDHAVLIAGLDHWRGDSVLVPEPRLLAHLQRRLGLPHLDLRAPPVPEREDEFGVGIMAWQFPEWFLAQYETRSEEHGRSRPLVNRGGLTRGRFQGEDPSGKRKRKDYPVVPLRFVQACPNGHVSDIDWKALVHREGGECVGGQLWFDETGTMGDLAQLSVRCDGCGAKPLSLVSLQGKTSLLGPCKGERPWLGPNATEPCRDKDGVPHASRLLIRHASNAYFPVIERAISIPDHRERLIKAVDAVWDDFLSVAEAVGDVKRERKKARVQKALEGWTDAEVWAECERRNKGEVADEARDLKEVELDTFLAVPAELGEDRPEGDFYARRLPPVARPEVEQVVLVHRLREVVAQLGFTRIHSPAMLIDPEVDLKVKMASLAMETRWLPAVENRGEGVFLSLDARRVNKWTTRESVKEKARRFKAGAERIAGVAVSLERLERFYMPYVMLHSFSHLLLTAIALECGYSAASIRERIYVREGEAYGVLLYTGTPDAEGTLGGLVQVGRNLERHLRAALELGALCSNDPVCAHHKPDQAHEDRDAHGAACHGCLLIAEPSCERRNEWLDRSLVVPTLAEPDAAFFSGMA